MSIAEIKKESFNLPNQEVTYLAAWFHHLSRRSDPGYADSLDNLFESMNSGDRISLEDYKSISSELEESGL
jgi:hypothetical protein